MACRPASPSEVTCRETLWAAAIGAWVLLYAGQFQLFLLAPSSALLAAATFVALALTGYLLASRSGRAAFSTALLAMLVWVTFAASLALSRRVATEGLWWWVTYFGIALLGHRLGRLKRQREAVASGLRFACAAVALVALVQALGLVPPAAPYLTEAGRLRVTGTLNHPNNLAGLLALVLPMAGAELWALGLERRRRPALWAGLVFVVLSAALLLTFSRGGQFAAAVGLVTLAVVGVGRRRLSEAIAAEPRRALLVGLAGLVVLVLGGVVLLRSGFGQRLLLGAELLGRLQATNRWSTWSAAASMVADSPWHGLGPGCFFLALPAAKTIASPPELFTHAHNWFLETAVEGGLPLLAGLLLTWLTACRGAAGAARSTTDWPTRLRLAGLAGGVVGFLAAGLLDFNVGVPAIGVTAWFVAGLAAGAARRGGPVKPAPALAVGGLLLFGLSVPWAIWNRGQAAYLGCLRATAQADWALAAERLDHARRLDPGLRAYELVRADLAIWSGRPRAAIAVLAPLTRGGQGSLPLESAWVDRLAWLLRDAGRGDEASSLLGQAAARDPSEPVLRIDQGLLQLAAGRSDLARVSLTHGAEADVDAAGALTGLGHLACRTGDLAQAWGYYEQAALTVDPRDRVPRFLIGYGRVDPVAVLPAANRGGLLTDRVRYQGPLLPRLRARLLAAEVLLQTTPGATAPLAPPTAAVPAGTVSAPARGNRAP